MKSSRAWEALALHPSIPKRRTKGAQPDPARSRQQQQSTLYTTFKVASSIYYVYMYLVSDLYERTLWLVDDNNKRQRTIEMTRSKERVINTSYHALLFYEANHTKHDHINILSWPHFVLQLTQTWINYIYEKDQGHWRFPCEELYYQLYKHLYTPFLIYKTNPQLHVKTYSPVFI
jgi:hypothetical protein